MRTTDKTNVDKDRPAYSMLVEQAIRTALTIHNSKESATNAVARTLGLTAGHARRKLRIGSWSLDELLTLQDEIGVSLVSVLSTSASAERRSLERAVMLINNQEIDCEVSVGPVMTLTSPLAKLACSKVNGRWVISTQSNLEANAPGQLRYAVEMLQVLDGGSPLRIAVLDDDFPTAESLASWFSEAGYPANAFASTDELEGYGIDNFDAFILDVVLGGGTCYDLVKKIRLSDPDTVIMLLTGKVRGNVPLEHQIAEVVRDMHVEIQMKPTSPGLLLASILSSIARKSASKAIIK